MTRGSDAPFAAEAEDADLTVAFQQGPVQADQVDAVFSVFDQEDGIGGNWSWQGMTGTIVVE